MKNVFWKKLFTAALVAIFAMVLFLSLYSDDNASSGDARLTNPDVSLELREGGIILIEGRGKLYRDDVLILLRQHKQKPDDIVDVIVGDGITEIDYGVFNEYNKLRTLKLGKNTAFINNGAIRDCSALEYIFLPSGLIRIGKDFAYNCNEAYVVTDGGKGDLGKLRNVPSDHILMEVRSFEDFAARCADNGSEIPDAIKQWWE